MKLELIEPKNTSYIVNACMDTCEAIKAAPTMIKDLMEILEKNKTAEYKGSTKVLKEMLDKGSLTLTIEKSGKDLIIKPAGKLKRQR
ncbi:MAG: hypothetical protein GF329_05825 [Candidatus Lokiarchaeota archaeon]|nr:hypothetical protein [Candidatus Lokiarchaeota archaeon]